MNISELCTTAHDDAVKKGFYHKPLETGTLLMLVVSELAEALEADRTNKSCDNLDAIDWLQWVDDVGTKPMVKESFEENIKNTFQDEIADAVIRIADICGYMGIDLESHIKAKMIYNRSRENKHGKEY